MVKNLLKKTVALSVILGVLTTMLCAVPVVYAAETSDTTEINGWKIIQTSSNDAFHDQFKENASMSVTDEWSRSGSKSLKVVYTAPPSGATYTLKLSAQSIGILEPGKYALSYTVHAVDADGKSLDNETENKTPRDIYQGLFRSEMTIGASAPSTVGNYTGDALSFGANGKTEFTTISRKFTLQPGYGAAMASTPSQTNIDNFFYFSFAQKLSAKDSRVAAIYIDDVELKKADSDGNAYGDNLIVNPSFENNAVQTPGYGAKEVKNEVTMGVAGKISLTWYNPSSTALSDVKLYEITDGSETELSAALDNTPDAKNTVVLTEQTRNRHYYKVVNTYTDGTKSEYIMSADASAVVRNNTLVNGWTVTDNKDTASNKSSAYLDTKYVKSGKTALHLKSNKSAYDYSDVMNVKTTVTVPSDYAADDYYKLSMWVKKNNVNGFFVRLNSNGAFPGFKVLGTNGTSTGNNFYLVQTSAGTTTVWNHGWQYFERIFKASDVNNTWTAGASMPFEIKLYNNTEDIWIDDVSLVKCNADGSTADGASELFANGGFEAADDYAVTGFDDGDVSAEAGNAEITVSYPTIDSGKKVNVYFKRDNGSLDFKGSLYSDKTSFTYKNLENEKEYTIVLAQADAITGLEQENPVEVSATPMPPAYEIGEYIIKNADGEVVTSVLAGTYSASVNVKNNTVAEGYPAVFIYAVYEGDTLADVDYVYENIVKGTEKTFELNNIVVGENQSLKLFLWQDFETLNILKEHWPGN